MDNTIGYNMANSIFTVFWLFTRFQFNFKRMSFKLLLKLSLKFLVHTSWFGQSNSINDNFKWKRNSDADYTGNLVDRKITSETWFLLRHLATASFFFKENICIFFISNNFQIAENFLLKPPGENHFWPYFQFSHFWKINFIIIF